MKHRSVTRRLKRDKDHRSALLRNLATSLIMHEKIETTLTKAKFVKSYVEKLVTRAKVKNQNNIRLVQKNIFGNQALVKLFNEISPRFESRNGGYTKITKLGFRDGDKAPMAVLSFVTEEKTTKQEAKPSDKKSINKKRASQSVLEAPQEVIEESKVE